MSTSDSSRRLTVYEVYGPSPRRRRTAIWRLIVESLRLAWRAAPGDLGAIASVQGLSVFGVAAQVLIARSLLAGLLRADRVSGTARQLAPRVIELAAVTAVLGVAQAVASNRQRLLAERCARYGENSVIAVTGAAPLGAFDQSAFHNRVARARIAVLRLPAMTAGLVAMVRALASALGAYIALIALMPLFAPLLLLIATPAWLASRARSRAFHGFARGFTPADRERQYLADLLINREPAKEVRVFGLQDHLRERHDRLWQERIDGLAEVAARQLKISVGADLLASGLVALTLLGLIELTLEHRLSLASAGAAAAAIVVLAQRVALAGSSAGSVSESALFLQDYLDLVHARARGPATSPPAGGAGNVAAAGLDGPTRPPGAAKPVSPLSAPATSLTVRAERVTFSYEGAREPALDDISMEISPGQVVALVGENGSGKSTLAKLLAGLYAPDRGRVTWNGVDATEAPDSARASIAVIFQDYLRYALPARDNIGLGDVSRIADLDAIERAAMIAGADGMLRGLPGGYDALLGPEFLDGTDLSLGQWQRVALARTVFRQASLVILDEPTASLDAHAEYDLFEHMSKALEGRGVLLISHRLSSVRRADEILVLSDGRIEERGTHDQLMELGGRYSRMFALQAAPYR